MRKSAVKITCDAHGCTSMVFVVEGEPSAHGWRGIEIKTDDAKVASAMTLCPEHAKALNQLLGFTLTYKGD